MSLTKQHLNTAIQQAFQSGDNQLALKLLKELSNRFPDNAENHYRYAVIEEQIGCIQTALSSYKKCIQLAPMNPIAHLYLGYCYHNNNNQEKANLHYSIAFDINENIIHLWKHDSQATQTKLRSEMASKTLSQLCNSIC